MIRGNATERECSAAARETAEDRLRAAHRRLRPELDLTEDVCARALGVPRSKVWKVDSGDERFPASWIARYLAEPITRELGIALLNEVVGDGLRVVDVPAAPTDFALDLWLAIEVQEQTSEVVHKHLRAIADGRLVRSEAAEIEGEIEEALHALLALRELMRLARREGVIALERVGAEGRSGT